MNFTKYEQRLPVVDPFDFGDRATLENGIWQPIQQEELMIPPTNTYIPQKLLSSKQKMTGKRKHKSTPEQIQHQQQLEQYGTINKQGSRQPLNDKNHNYHYNPFRGNTYAIGQLGKETYMVLPCGDSLTELRIVLMTTQNVCLKDNNDDYHWISDNGIPLGHLSSAASAEMHDPILQIRVSTALDVTMAKVDKMVIGVRTIRNTSLFKLVRNQQSLSLNLIHCFDPSFSTFNTGYCRPAHIVLSPYFGLQYAFVGDNGYVAVFDIQKMAPENSFGIIYETALQTTDDSNTHSKRWKACVFGPHPKTLIVASSSHVALLEFKSFEMYPEKVLYTCSDNQRIYCLESLNSRNIFQFCFSTKDQIILMDSRYPNQPVISWKHHFINNPPVFLELARDSLNSSIVNILAWPLEQDAVIHLQYQYNGRLEFSSKNQPPYVKPAIYSRPDFIILKIHKTKCSFLDERIPVIGTAMKIGPLRCKETGQLKQLAVVFRLLNNGAVYTQRFVTMDETYPDFDRPPPTQAKQCQQRWVLSGSSKLQSFELLPGDGILDAHTKSKEKENSERQLMYRKWDNSAVFFEDILYRAITSKLSVHLSRVRLHESNILKANFPTTMEKLIKLEMKLWQLDRQSLEEFDYVIQNYHLSRPKSALTTSNRSDWIPFPGQDNIMDSAYQAISSNICNTYAQYNSTQNLNREELNHHFASDMYANLMIYLPVPTITATTDESHNAKSHQQFKYLRRKNETFEPTATTLLMAHDWNIADPNIKPPDLLESNTAFNPRQPLFRYHKTLPDQRPTSNRHTSNSAHSQDFALPPAISSSYSSNASQDLYFKPTTINNDVNSSFTSISTQPTPGVFANRKRPSSEPKKKKKKKLVSGFM